MRCLKQVPKLPGEPEVYADAFGCAFHADGEPLWWSEVDADESGRLLAVLERHGLKARNDEYPYNREALRGRPRPSVSPPCSTAGPSAPRVDPAGS